MARLLLLLAAASFLLFGLGYLGAPKQNTGLIIIAIILFLMGLSSGRRLQKRRLNPLDAQIEFIDGLVTEGKKIEAIRVYRELTGSSLKDAKAYVEGLEATQLSSASVELPLTEDLTKALRALKEESRIEAIREVHKITGLSLREAKNIVDDL